MSSPWQIQASAPSVVLHDERGEVAFTIVNASPAPGRAVFSVRALDGAAEMWFVVDQPMHALDPGASATVPVAIAVPHDTPEGTYGLQGVAYSADDAPDETFVASEPIAIVVPPPPPKSEGRAVSAWQISESATSVTLRNGRGSVTFTITNGGPAADRVVLTVRGTDGAGDTWFEIDRPQRSVEPAASVLVPVAIAPPGGTPIGTYGLQGIAYSADHDPSETSVVSKRVEVVVPNPLGDDDHGSPRWPYIVAALVVLLVIAVIVFLVVSGGDDGGAPPPTAPTTGPAPTPQPTPAPSPQPTPAPQPAQPLVDPDGPNIRVLLDSCDVVPNGSLSGADQLTMFLDVRNDGPGAVDQLVRVSAASDTGLGGSMNTAAGGSGVAALQVDLGPGDFDRQHTFTIVADPADEIVESNESDNTRTVVVALPARPTSGSESVPCS